MQRSRQRDNGRTKCNRQTMWCRLCSTTKMQWLRSATLQSKSLSAPMSLESHIGSLEYPLSTLSA
jgi:predicted metal-binding transcription factor (methanogenesis marker protein 9)